MKRFDEKIGSILNEISGDSKSEIQTVELTIPEHNIDMFKNKIRELAKRANKIGVRPPTFEIKSEYLKKIYVGKDSVESPIYYETLVYDIVLKYELITIVGGWKFIAAVKLADSVDGVARNIVSGPKVPDAIYKKYITANQTCEHCGIKRPRKETYIIQSENGSVKQIGSSCLKSYLGIDPSSAVASFEFFKMVEDLIDDMEDVDKEGYERRIVNFYPSREFAAVVLSMVKADGFVTAEAAELHRISRTGDAVVEYLTLKNKVKNGESLVDSKYVKDMAPTSEMIETANIVVDRLENRILEAYKKNPGSLDQFSFKVGVVLNHGGCSVKEAQLFAAAINREARKLAQSKQPKNKSEWYPNVKEGDKVKDVEVVVAMIRPYESMYGAGKMIKFITSDGYSFTTFYSGSNMDVNEGDNVKLSGTVKKLDDGKYGKTTLLTRIKII